jgi:VCBS repeat-containing protein
MLLSSSIKQKIPKVTNNHLLTVLALAALPSKVFAAKETPEKVEIKGYLLDVAKLAKDAGIEVSDIDELVIALSDPSLGELIYLGNGIYQIIASSGVYKISLVIANADASQSSIELISLDQVLPLDGGTIDYSDFDISDFQYSLISASSSTSTVDLVGMAVAGVAMIVASISKSSATSESLEGVISDGLLNDAQVFLDLDDDGVLDWTDANDNSLWDAGEGEQWTLSAEDGSYTLSDISAADIAAGTLIGQAYKIGGVSQTVDMVSGSDVANLIMMAETTATVITPLTSLIKSGISNDDALNILGLDGTDIDINSFNPFSTENDGTANAIAFEKVAAKLFTTVNTIAEAIDSAADDNLDAVEGFILAMTQVASAITDEVESRAEGNDAVDLNLSDAATIADITNKTITAADAKLGTDTVSNDLTALVTSVSKAIVNVNTEIESITAFDVATAKDTLTIGAETLSTQVKAAVESATTITLAADTLVSLTENDTSAQFTAVAGDATSLTGEYGDISNDDGSTWTYTVHTSNGQAQADGESYADTFVITDSSDVEHEVTVMLIGKNDAPVFTSSATASVFENETAVATIVATDVDTSDTISYSISGTDSALFSIDGSTGVLTFVDAPDYEGVSPAHGDPHSNEYTLTVTASDGTTTTDQALTVTVANVEGGPVFTSAATVAVDENQTAVLTLSATDDEFDNIAFTISGGDDAASFSVADGVLTFAASPNYEVKSSYSVTITASETTDINGATIASPNTTDQAITVSINDVNDAAVIAGTSTGAVTEDASTTTATGTLTHTDADADNDDNEFTAVATATDSVKGYGTYTMTAEGVWTYTLDNTNSTVSALAASATATDTFAVTAEDGTSQTVTVTITGVNDAPTTVADSATIAEDASATVISVLANDSDPEGTTLTLASKSAATNGGTVTNNGDGTVSYTPVANYNGSDTFTYTATDGTEASASTTVTVTITAVNDDPTGAVTIAGTTKTGSTLTASNTLADVDGLGDISYQWAKDGTDVSGATNSTLVLDDDDVGSTFTVTASYTDDDGTAESATSDASGTVVDMVKLIQVRNITTMTAAEASTAINGEDYSSGSTETVAAFDLYLDAEGIDSLNASASEVYGTEFTLGFTANDLDSVSTFASEENATWIMEFDDESGVFTISTVNNATGAVALGDASAVVDIDTTNDTGRNTVLIEQKIGTVYINPADGVDDIQLTLEDILVDAGDVNVEPLSYTVDVL